jgi:7-carboxy-7-deazaguanine synthase
MKINLVRNGIFPVTRTAGGETAETPPATGYGFPGTLQGEGKLSGVPALFIRTSGCNLRCTWISPQGELSVCDTPYASHYPGDVEARETSEIVSTVRNNLGSIRHIVISGGEPTLQPGPLSELAKGLKKELDIHITIETNGVLFIPELVKYVDFFSISPKLKSSEPDKKKNKLMELPVEENYIRDHRKFRINIDTLQKYINACMNLGTYYGERPGSEPTRKPNKDFQLKFVISEEGDMEEIQKDFLDHLSFVYPDDVILMPVGGTPELLQKTSHLAVRLAIQNGFRYSPRLQIDLWGDTAGT